MSKSPAFEHRHYKRIASIIADLRHNMTEDECRIIAEAFANALKGTNPNYSRERFLTAALGDPINGRDKVQ